MKEACSKTGLVVIERPVEELWLETVIVLELALIVLQGANAVA